MATYMSIGHLVCHSNFRAHRNIAILTFLVIPESPPSPLALIPVRQDFDFVGREELLTQLTHHALPGRMVALVGIGGVGCVTR